MGAFFLKFKGTAITRVPPLREANGGGEGKRESPRRKGWEHSGAQRNERRVGRGRKRKGEPVGERFSDKDRELEWLLAALLPFTLPQLPRNTKGLSSLHERRAQETLCRTNRKCGRLALPERFAPRAHFLVISVVRLATDSHNSTELPAIPGNGTSVSRETLNNVFRQLCRTLMNAKSAILMRIPA